MYNVTTYSNFGTCEYKNNVVNFTANNCYQNAKWQLCMLKLLLEKNAERAKAILADFTPLFASKEAYLSFVDAMNQSGDRITYHEDGTATVQMD